MTDKEKIRAEIERLKNIADKNSFKWNDSARAAWRQQSWVCGEIISFIDSLSEETDAVEGVVSYLVGADQAAIKYKDPSGIFMSYYAKRGDLKVGDKVKIVIFKEK